MKIARLVGLVVLGAACAAAPARGQTIDGTKFGLRDPSASHVPLGDPSEADLRALAARLITAKQSAELQGLLADVVAVLKKDPQILKDPKRLEEYRNRLQGLRGLSPDDPLVARLRKAYEQRRQGIDPAAQQKLRDLIQSMGGAQAGASPRHGASDAGTPGGPQAGARPSPPPEARRVPQPPPPAGRHADAPPEGDEEPTAGGIQPSDWLSRWAERAVRDNPELARSPAMQQAVRQWVDSMDRARRAADPERHPGWGAGWLRGVGDRLRDRWAGFQWPAVRQLPLPRFNLPSPRFSMAPPPVGRPTVVLPSARATGWTLLLLVAVAVGIAVWWNAAGRARQTAADGSSWQPGPWPVSPGSVATWHDVQLAFEHLALLRLGLDARSRNHRELAAELGGADREQRRAAEHLAGLYEQARYAPDAGPLPEADVCDARRELYLLAGVAAV